MNGKDGRVFHQRRFGLRHRRVALPGVADGERLLQQPFKGSTAIARIVERAVASVDAQKVFRRRQITDPAGSRQFEIAVSETGEVERRLGVEKPHFDRRGRSEEHTSELQPLMRCSDAALRSKKKNTENIK